MVQEPALRLLVEDPSVLASLQFSLSIEGFQVGEDASGVIIIDEQYGGDGVGLLEEMRGQGCAALAIVIATHPSRRLRNRIANCDAILVEKPLMGNEISSVLNAARDPLKVA